MLEEALDKALEEIEDMVIPLSSVEVDVYEIDTKNGKFKVKIKLEEV